MSVFLMCMLVPDIGYRTRHYNEERWLHAATPRNEPEEDYELEAAGEHQDRSPPRSGGEH